MDDEIFDASELTALVIDHDNFQRKISIDQLRMIGFRRAMGAADTNHAWDLIQKAVPDVILIEWLDASNGGLEFVRRIRTSPDSPNPAVSIFMLTSRGAQNDVESARAAGVDGYLRKPISGLALGKRVRAVVANPQPFIATTAYVGPCRRRRDNPAYEGPLRRMSDRIAVALDAAEVETRARLARERVAALDAAAQAFTSGDSAAARRVFRAAQELSEAAEQIGDDTLGFGCREMMRYLQSQGATARLDPDVVRTHVAALHQVAHLPVSLSKERERVAHSLKRMVDKKLRQIAAG